jgi:hypothetical protein
VSDQGEQFWWHVKRQNRSIKIMVLDRTVGVYIERDGATREARKTGDMVRLIMSAERFMTGATSSHERRDTDNDSVVNVM